MKHNIAVEFNARKWREGETVLPIVEVLEEAECGASVRRLKDLFKGHATRNEVIKEGGSNCWLEV